MKTFLSGIKTSSTSLFLILIFSMLIPGFPMNSTCAAESTSRVILVGSEKDFKPYGYVDEKGQPAGYSIDLIRAVADAMGLNIRIVTGSWDNVWNDLVEGKIDVLPVVARLPNRETLVDFSLPHTETFDAFFVRKGAQPIPSIAAAQGKEIVVMRSDAAHHALEERHFQGKVIPVDTIPEGLKLVASGKHDALLCSKLIGVLAIRKHGIGGLDAGRPIPDYKREFSFAVKKGDFGLIEKLNQGLLIVKTNRQFDRILEKWLTRNERHIIVGGEYDYPPYSYLNKKGDPEGFAVDLTRAIARTMGLDVEIRLGPWAEIRKSLEQGEIDVILGMFYSEERARIVDFSQPYSMISDTIFARKDAQPARSLGDLRNKEIIVMKGEIMHDYIVRARLTDRIVLAETPKDVMLMLSSGKGDYALAAEIPARYWIRELKLSNITSMGEPVQSSKNCFAVRKGDTLLLRQFSQGLEILNKTGEYPRLYEKWLGVLEPQHIPVKTILAYSGIVIITITLILSVSVIWTVLLRRKVREKTAELQKSEERLSLALSGTGEGIIEWDLVADQITIDKELSGMLGFSVEEFPRTGNDFLELIHPGDRVRGDGIFNDLIAGNTTMFDFEERFRTKQGEWKWILARGRIVSRDASGRALKYIGTHVDIHQLKVAEQKLIESEERYRNLIEQADEGIFSLDNDNRFVTVNPKICRMLGYTMDELLQLTILDTYPDKIREDAGKRLSQLRSGTRLRFERPMKCKDGSFILIEASAVMLEDGLIQAIVHDITERRQAEKALKASESKYRNLHESMMDAYVSVDMNGFITEHNNVFQEMLGYSPEETRILTYSDITPPKWHALEAEIVEQQVLQRGFSDVYEKEYRRKDGTVFPIELRTVLMRDNEGLPVGMWAVVRDITERKRAEMEMARLVSAIEQAAECVEMTDLEGKILYVNPAFEKITGYTREEALGQNPRVLKSGMQDEAFYRDLWETITRGDIWSGRFVNKRKNGTLYHEEASITPIRDKSGSIVNFVAVKRDITREMQLEEQMQRSQRLQAIGTLAGGIAHDFNNILTTIIGFSEVIEEEVPLESKEHEHIIEVLRSGERARDLVKQILTFSRQMESAKEPVEVHLILKETVKLLKASIPKNITITEHIKTRTAPVLGDPTKIHQVIMNLCTNAYHAMIPDGGELTVGLETVSLDEESAQRIVSLNAGEHLCLSVSDTGSGMDEDTMKRIFDPFFTTKERGKGTGLGLATVYGIVTELGGAITVDSAPGKGSTLAVYLPVTERRAAERSEEVEELQPAIKKGHILVVDDEETIIHFTRIMLEQIGYSVTGMTSSTEALMLFRSAPQQFDLVMTDQVMPETSGLQIAKEMFEVRPDLPVILMTGFSETVNEDIAKAAGIREYVEKPFTKKSIQKIIQRCLDDPSV